MGTREPVLYSGKTWEGWDVLGLPQFTPVTLFQCLSGAVLCQWMGSPCAAAGEGADPAKGLLRVVHSLGAQAQFSQKRSLGAD